jgi:threonine synthase
MGATYLRRLRCPRCDQEVGEEQALDGCSACRADAIGVNLAPAYEVTPGPLPERSTEPGIFRFRDLLPLGPTEEVVSLGEGRTPLLPLTRLGGFDGARLWLKDESRNPTWSYKDRLAAVAVSKAAASGASTVIVSSTGNHGAAVAAYAAAAGLECVVLTLESVPLPMKTLMQMYGARVVALGSVTDRWTLMRAAIEKFGWTAISGYANPPIGSNAFGVDGYKTIAYELWTELADAPDVVVVPTAYGDGLAGILRGFEDLLALDLIDRLPRLVAVDPFGAYAANLGLPEDESAVVPTAASLAFSVATSLATYQGLSSIRRTNGTAVGEPSDAAIVEMQRRLAATEGIYVEASAALPLLAVENLRRCGWIDASETTVVVSTSSGLKDPESSSRFLPEIPVIEPSLVSLEQAISAVDAR